MRPHKVEVRGCCMGIPFGCGSLLLIGIGVGLWQQALSGFSLLVGLALGIGVLIVGAALLIAAEWFRETRRHGPIPAGSHAQTHKTAPPPP